MKLYATETPLLKSVEASISAMGGGESIHPAFRGVGTEYVSGSWFPDPKHGILYLDADTFEWESGGPSDEPENLQWSVASDGLFQIGPGDDFYYNFTTTIRSGDEIPDILDFYENVDADRIGSSANVTRQLKELIEDVFILIPEADGTVGLLSILKDNWASKDTGISKQLDAHFIDGSYDLAMDNIYVSLDYYLDQENRYDHLPPRSNPGPKDLLLSAGSKLLYYGMFEQDTHSYIGSDPTLVIRLKKNTSPIWLTDYLEFAAEAKGVLANLTTNWKSLRNWLSKHSVKMPSIPRDQIAASIIRRAARYNYLEEVKSLSNIPEAFEDLSRLYQKRTKAVQSLHSSLLDDVDGILNPLPYFIEYPYRIFRKSEDIMDQARAGQRLLGVFTKVPLFLVLEELSQKQQPLSDEIIQSIETRPPSDGTLLELQRRIHRELKTSTDTITLFRGLLDFFGDNAELNELVTARNRMHHEPYDNESFVEFMKKSAPIIIDKLRKALVGCEFLIPKQIQFIDNVTIVCAENISGADTQFQSVEIKTELAPQLYQTGKIVVRSQDPENALPIGLLLASKTIKQQTRDFGIFDRVTSSERKFVFIREDSASDISKFE